jgi:hypothetical protein
MTAAVTVGLRFIAGLPVCPDLIKPGEWLPIVWDRDSGDPQPPLTILIM